ncbi:hypothetical protein HY632_03235, partial [Candidatus Uhrbacteria bacterium]|nr:hypothetical protein [Candidatus Uhrbacteria bacterium]
MTDTIAPFQEAATRERYDTYLAALRRAEQDLQTACLGIQQEQDREARQDQRRHAFLAVLACTESGDDPFGHIVIGSMQEKFGEHDEAMRSFHRAADEYRRQGSLLRAFRAYRRAIIAGNSRDALHTLPQRIACMLASLELWIQIGGSRSIERADLEAVDESIAKLPPQTTTEFLKRFHSCRKDAEALPETPNEMLTGFLDGVDVFGASDTRCIREALTNAHRQLWARTLPDTIG